MDTTYLSLEGKIALITGGSRGINTMFCLDAATGEIVREYEDTASTLELVVSEGVIFANVDPDEVEYEDYRDSLDTRLDVALLPTPDRDLAEPGPPHDLGQR